MYRLIIGAIALSLLLSGCSTANITANEAALKKFFQTADADLQAAWAGILENCQAIEALAIDAGVLACIAQQNSKTQNAVQRGIAAANAACNLSQPPGPATIGSVVSTIAASYRAAKGAQQGNGCGV